MNNKAKGGNFLISYENFKDTMDSVFDKEEYLRKMRAQSLKDLESTNEEPEREIETQPQPEPEQEEYLEGNVGNTNEEVQIENNEDGILKKKNAILL